MTSRFLLVYCPARVRCAQGTTVAADAIAVVVGSSLACGESFLSKVVGENRREICAWNKWGKSFAAGFGGPVVF